MQDTQTETRLQVGVCWASKRGWWGGGNTSIPGGVVGWDLWAAAKNGQGHSQSGLRRCIADMRLGAERGIKWGFSWV